MHTPEVRHRLAAILAADAAGYSRLMAADDRAALAALDAARGVFRAQVEAHDGRVVDTAGDSVLAVFATAGGAVSAALAIQQQLAGAARAKPRDGQLPFRIGIHLGDVLEKADGSVYGDGVNIAARLQGLCETGGVAVSHAVHGAVPSRIQARFEDIGEQAVKNIAAPVRAFRLRADWQAEASAGRALCFGRVEVWAQQRRLCIDGEDAALGGRAFDLLVALIERRDRLVSRSELYELVWPGRVVEENNLAVQVLALRKVLGADAIATVPGRGYRFTLAASDEGAERSEVRSATPLRPAREAAVWSRPTPEAATLESGPEPFALPAAPSALFGRDDELAALEHLLARHRHVTVLGAGGIGKTSLALAGAHARRQAQRNGAAWVDLSSLSQPALVTAAVAQALHLPVSRGEHPLPALMAGLKTLEVLLVLDNAEHLVDAVARLADAIAAAAPGVRLLVTSQVALKVEHERVFRLGPLSVPEAGTSAYEAMSHGAVALFIDQAQAADRRFELSDDNVATVIDLCRHLDGLALAIKLAAGRLVFFGLQGLEQRLAERLKLLAGSSRSAPTRQQTLRAALDWSHGLLSAEEQATFRRLGVFAGGAGFSLELARAVAGGPGEDEWAVIEHVAALVDHSLVQADSADPPRYRLLESAREYALLKLDESGESHATQHRLACAMLVLFERYDGITTPDAVLLATYAGELDNLRAALDWSARNDRQLAVDLLGRSGGFHILIGLPHEHRRRCTVLEPALGPDTPAAIAGRYWSSRAGSALPSLSTSVDCARKAATLFRSAGERHRLYQVLLWIGWGGCPADEWEAAQAELDQIEEPGWPPSLRAWRKNAESVAHLNAGRFAEARVAAEAGVKLANSVGSRRAAAATENTLVAAELNLGHVDEALRRSRTLIAQEQQVLGGLLELTYGNYAAGLILQSNLEEARKALAELFQRCRLSEGERFPFFVHWCARFALAERRYEAAARLTGYAAAERLRRGVAATRIERQHASTRATLASVFDPPTLERLMAEGEQLDQEAVFALTLEPADDDRDSSIQSRAQPPSTSDRA